MVSILLSGCNGHMGQVITSIADSDPGIAVTAGIDVIVEQRGGYPVYSSPADFNGKADVVIDFSSPSALDGLIAFGISTKTPLVLCATGYSLEQIEAIDRAAGQIPIFRSANMSLGINLLADLIRRTCAVLGRSFDVEVVERHHRRKVDAPSGTAMMLAETASSALPFDPEYIFERQSRRQPRNDSEIGISAVRGGTIVGEHEVIFAGLDEIIELKHTALSRDVFAVGALRAAKFIAGINKPGLYNMNDALNN